MMSDEASTRDQRRHSGTGWVSGIRLTRVGLGRIFQWCVGSPHMSGAMAAEVQVSPDCSRGARRTSLISHTPRRSSDICV